MRDVEALTTLDEQEFHRGLPAGLVGAAQPILSPSFAYLDGATGEV